MSDLVIQDLHSTFFEVELSLPIINLGFGNISQQFIGISYRN